MSGSEGPKGLPSTEEIIARYRARRADASDDEPVHGDAAPPVETPARTGGRIGAPAAREVPPGDTPAPSGEAAPPPREEMPATGDAPMHLGLGNPLFEARERLAHHPFVAPRRPAGLVPLGLGLVALAAVLDALVGIGFRQGGLLDRLDEAVGLQAASFLAAGLGAAALLLGVLGRRRPRVRVAMPPRQSTAWALVQDRARGQRLLTASSYALFLLGTVLAWFAGRRAPEPFQESVGALGALLLVAGLAAMLTAAARRGALRDLYAQTWLLAWLEQAGLGGPDEQVQRVLLAIDGLLGGLPDEHVEAFLASPVCEEYASLVDQARAAMAEGGGR